MMKTIAKTTFVAAALISLSTGVMAKDWIEKVEVKRDGIDVIPVEVSANAHKYTGIASNSHKFLLRLYAKAKKGKRIVAMQVGPYNGVRYFEASSRWNKDFENRAVGSGSKRTVAFNYTPTIPLNKVDWKGRDPREACMVNMDKQIKGGLTKKQVLSKTWTVKAKVYFELDAVAARKNKAKKNKWNMKNTTSQRDGNSYDVTVKCRKGV